MKEKIIYDMQQTLYNDKADQWRMIAELVTKITELENKIEDLKEQLQIQNKEIIVW